MSSGCDHFLLGHRQCVQEGSHGCLTEAPTSLVWACFVVFTDPCIEIGLQFIDRTIHLFSKRDAVELVQHGLVEALADAVGLRTFGLGAGVIDVLDRQVELVFVSLGVAAVFAAAVGQHARECHGVALEQRDRAIIDQIGRRDRRLAVVEFGANNLAVGVDEGLLVDAPDPLHGPDIECVLGALSNSPCVSFSVLAFSSATTCASVSTSPSCALLASSALSRLFMVSRSWRSHTQRTPAGDTVSPRFFSSLAMRTCPKAGCSTAIATIASSTSCGTRFFGTGFLRLISCRASSPPCS